MVRAKLGLDQPLWLQYLAWLQRVSRGDLGRSLVDDRRSSATSLTGYLGHCSS